METINSAAGLMHDLWFGPPILLLIAWVCSLWMFISLGAAGVARAKGYSSNHWLAAGMFFGPFALLMLAALPSRKRLTA